MTCHSKGLLSSTKPAENPESVFLFRSAPPYQKATVGPRQAGTKRRKKDQRRPPGHTKDGFRGTERSNFTLDAVIPTSG